MRKFSENGLFLISTKVFKMYLLVIGDVKIYKYLIQNINKFEEDEGVGKVEIYFGSKANPYNKFIYE